MASAFAQRSIHTGHKIIQNIKGDKGLDGAGDATAVDPVSAPTL